MKVSRAGYGKWSKRIQSERALNTTNMMNLIREIFFEHERRAGAIKIHKELELLGYTISDRTVSRYMEKMGLKTKYKRGFKKTTDSNHSLTVAPNRLQRRFNVKHRNRVWVSDITYIRTYQGWLYLCVVIDLYNRKVVGWSLGRRMKRHLVLNAYYRACRNERPNLRLMFHSDRGSQYCSNEFQKVLKMNKHIQSMSRRGDCWDNAVAESFFKTLKVELIYCERIFGYEDCRNKLFEYIEIYYNKKRRHSTLGYVSPENYGLRKAA